MQRETVHSFSSSSSEPVARSQPYTTRGEKLVIWIVSAPVFARFLLGTSKHGRPLFPRARELFIPAGVFLLLLVGSSARRRRPDQTSLWFGLASLALVGVGL